jgi:hypothetical protein
MSTQPEEQEATHRQISWRSPEILGEAVLLLIVLGLAITYIYEMTRFGMPGRYLPIVTLTFVTPFWLIRVRTLFQRKKLLEAGSIMDLGFRFSGDAAPEKRRAFRYVVSVAALFISIWLVGFHLALPIWVMTYLFLFAKIKLWVIPIIGACFVAFMLGVHDFIIDVPWPEPVLWRLVGVEYLFNYWPIDDTY